MCSKRVTATLTLPSCTSLPAISPELEQPISSECGKAARSWSNGAGSVAESAPAGSVHAGFYSYGEIAPAVAGRRSELHNQTMTVTLLGEA